MKQLSAFLLLAWFVVVIELAFAGKLPHGSLVLPVACKFTPHGVERVSAFDPAHLGQAADAIARQAPRLQCRG